MLTKRAIYKIVWLIIAGVILAVFNLDVGPNSKNVVKEDVGARLTGEGLVSATTTTALVVRAVDGDTIELDSGQKVRYIGVNSPETVDPRRAVQCFGKEASMFNSELVEGKNVRLVKDVSDTDKYGRLLRYVYLEDGTFVNEKLVVEGYAKVSTYPPDVSMVKLFQEAEAFARTNKKGLWDACK